MTERRKTPRSRCLLSGVIAYRDRSATLDCTVRSLSHEGATLSFGQSTAVPDQFELMLTGRSTAMAARVVWSDGRRYGVALQSPEQARPVPHVFDLAGRVSQKADVARKLARFAG